MDNTPTVHILYVGRKTTVARDLASMLVQEQAFGANRERTAEIVSSEQPVPLIDFQAVSNQKAAFSLARKTPPDIVLVELDAKPNSRICFCEMLRYRLPTTAIVSVADARSSNQFDFDEQIAIPLNSEQVELAISQVLEQRNASHRQLQLGSLRLDLATRTVFTQRGQYYMTPKQCSLLTLLMENHNSVVKRVEIMQEIWNTSYMDDTRTLDVHIRWLRERIEPDPSNPIYLRTVRGIGYRLCMEG